MANFNISGEVSLFGSAERIRLDRNSEVPSKLEYRGAYKVTKENLGNIVGDDVAKYLPDAVVITDVMLDTTTKAYEFGFRVENPLAFLEEVGLDAVDKVIKFHEVSIFVSGGGETEATTA